jgi:colicin import membrane protein
MQEATPATERLQRDAFAPPPERGLGPAATLAILVHLALLLCLSWVVKWRDQPVILTAQAELWAKLPPQTEPEPVPVPPPPPAEPAPPPPPPPPPPPAKAKVEPVKPAPKAEPAPPPKVINGKLADAEIAEQKKKAKKLADEQAQKLALEEEAARKQKEKDEADANARKQKEKEEAEATVRKQKEKEEAEATVRKQKEKEEAEATVRKQKEKEKEEAEATVRKQKEKEEAEATVRKQKEKEETEAIARKQKEKEETARKERERQRKDQEDRIAKLAKESEIKEQTEDLKKRIVQKADADSNAPETASKSVGKPSDKYIASIQAAIRPNITFTDALAGNPAVEIHVRLASDGAIISSAIVNSSGIKSWDTAAMRALDKTERLPKDENGRVPPAMTITLRPRDR